MQQRLPPGAVGGCRRLSDAAEIECRRPPPVPIELETGLAAGAQRGTV